MHQQSPQAQALQFGYNCDYVEVLPLPGRRAPLVVNHEYTDEELMYPAGEYDDATKQIATQAHGISVLEIERGRADGSWPPAPSGCAPPPTPPAGWCSAR